MSPRHVLLVSWWFPPLSGGGVHRPLQFARHLAKQGHRVTVLTGVPPAGEPVDEALLRKVPQEMRVLRVRLPDPFRAWARLKGARPAAAPATHPTEPAAPQLAPANRAARPRWRDLVTSMIAVPDKWLPWIVPATAHAAIALRGDEPDLVLSSSPPRSMHLVAHALAGLFSCPLVLDFRDPWIGNPFKRYAAPLFVRAEAALERKVVLAASQIVLNTPALERQFQLRYGALVRTRTIPNGFDPDAFEGLPPATGGGTPGFVELAHYGQLYGPRSGRFLVQALARLKADVPDAFARARIVLFGAVDGDTGVLALAAELGVDGALALPGALPHQEALARQRASDVLLLLGPENREPEVQVPGKLYEYFAARRPILALSRAGGAIDELLRSSGVPHERAEPDAPDEIAAALARLIERAGRADSKAAAGGSIDLFRYDRLTERLADCLDEAWRRAGRSPAGAASGA